MNTFETAAAAMIEAQTARMEIAREFYGTLGSATARLLSWWKGLVSRSPQDGVHLG